MSSPGIMPMTGQMTPEFMQQMQAYQDQMRKQQMAQALMQNNANPQTQNAGIANAGSSIMGALTMRDMQRKASDPTSGMTDQMGVPLSGNSSWMSGLGKLFSMGGK